MARIDVERNRVVVERGDNLTSIANTLSRVPGRGTVTVNELIEANKNEPLYKRLKANQDHIEPDWDLVLPDVGPATVVRESVGKPTPSEPKKPEAKREAVQPVTQVDSSAVATTPPTRDFGLARHPVRRGDVLERVAGKYGVTVEALIDAQKLTNPGIYQRLRSHHDVLMPGWTLYLPGNVARAPDGTSEHPASKLELRPVLQFAPGLEPRGEDGAPPVDGLKSHFLSDYVPDSWPWKSQVAKEPELTYAYFVLLHAASAPVEDRVALRQKLGLAGPKDGADDAIVVDLGAVRKVAGRARDLGRPLNEDLIYSIQSANGIGEGAAARSSGNRSAIIGPETATQIIKILAGGALPEFLDPNAKRPDRVAPVVQPPLYHVDGISDRVARLYPQLASLAQRPEQAWRFPTASAAPVSALQRLLNRLGAEPPVRVDGAIGASAGRTRKELARRLDALGIECKGDPLADRRAFTRLLAAADTLLDQPVVDKRVTLSVARADLPAHLQGAHDIVITLARENPHLLRTLYHAAKTEPSKKTPLPKPGVLLAFDLAMLEQIAGRSKAFGYALDPNGLNAARQALYIGGTDAEMTYELASGLTHYFSMLFGERGLAAFVGADGAPPSSDYLSRSGKHDKHFLAHTGGDVSPALLKAISTVENKLQARGNSSAGAQGLMQFMPATAQRFGLHDRNNPGESVRAGRKYMTALLAYVEKHDLAERNGLTHGLPLALASYNAGENKVRLHEGMPPYAETAPYPATILLLKGLYEQRDEPKGAQQYAAARQAALHGEPPRRA